MTDPINIEPIRGPVPFTIDGQPFTTKDTRQKAFEILRLAGLDPNIYDLGELRDKDRPQTQRFADDDLVDIEKDARFVSIRQSADVA